MYVRGMLVLCGASGSLRLWSVLHQLLHFSELCLQLTYSLILLSVLLSEIVDYLVLLVAVGCRLRVAAIVDSLCLLLYNRVHVHLLQLHEALGPNGIDRLV